MSDARDEARAALDQLIEKAKGWLDQIEGEWGRGESYEDLLAQGDEEALIIASAEKVLALFDEPVPADDERVIRLADERESLTTALEQVLLTTHGNAQKYADEVLALLPGFRRQGQITDAMVDAALNAWYGVSARWNHKTRTGMRAALEAAEAAR